jgi:hypothetical protein
MPATPNLASAARIHLSPAQVVALDSLRGQRHESGPTITMTFDRYGHLMPGGRDEARERVDAYLAASR